MTSNWSAPDRADDLAAVERGYEQLRHASSISWSTPLASCLNFSGSAFSM